MKKSETEKTVVRYNRQKIAKDIRDWLQWPTGRDIKRSPGMKVVNTVFKTIVKGLERDGVVKIEGFGTFKVKTRKAYTLKVTRKWGPLKGITEYIDQPAKTYVSFRSYQPLKDFINNKNQEDECQN
jgi:nucleoid DNA-binding protein